MKGEKGGGGGGGKGVFSAPGDYVYFKSLVPLHKIPVGSKQWRYYDFGPKAVLPLICLPGTAGTADVYYKQVMALSMKGYRVISVDIPCVWNHNEWVHLFEKFLDSIDVHRIHLYGTSLGGFLAQLFTQHRPRRVKSLLLSNTFLDTHSFVATMPWAPIVSWTPSFLLKRYVLTGIRDGPHEPFIADSVDFVVSQVEALSRDDLASRLTLTFDSASIAPFPLPDKAITIMDTHDYCAIPQQLKDEVGERYPGARRADLKSGGDFPFLSRPDEVNLHLQLHLRRVGLEPRPDLVPGAPKTSNVGNPRKRTENCFEDSSSGGPTKSRDIEDEDEPKNILFPPKAKYKDVIDLPIADNDSCRGPLRRDEREDEDDSHEDDRGSSRAPSRKVGTGNIVGPREEAVSSSKGGKDVSDAPKDVDHIASMSSLEKPSLSGFPVEIVLLYALQAYAGALYIACSFSCRSRLMGV